MDKNIFLARTLAYTELKKASNRLLKQANSLLDDYKFESMSWRARPIDITFGTLAYEAFTRSKTIIFCMDKNLSCCRFQNPSETVTKVDIYILKQAITSNLEVDWFPFSEDLLIKKKARGR